jgi:hypothetical protein
MSQALKEQHGGKDLYSAAELEDVIRIVGLSGRQREYAYAMFTDEDVCNGFLSRVGASRTARELRFILGGSMFGSAGAVGYESSWNRFHDYDNEVLGGLQSFGGSSSGGSGGGWGDDGGYDSGDGGGGGESGGCE